jgi:hypothetical protein
MPTRTANVSSMPGSAIVMIALPRSAQTIRIEPISSSLATLSCSAMTAGFARSAELVKPGRKRKYGEHYSGDREDSSKGIMLAVTNQFMDS